MSSFLPNKNLKNIHIISIYSIKNTLLNVELTFHNDNNIFFKALIFETNNFLNLNNCKT